MKQNDVFPSNFLKSADLAGKAVRVTIERVTLEELGDDKKPVLHFLGKSKGMVINKTNWGVLVNLTGREDSDHWGGWSIVIYSAKVAYQGKMVDGLRVDDRPGAAKAPAKAQRQAPPVEDDEPVEDFADIDADVAPDDSEMPF